MMIRPGNTGSRTRAIARAAEPPHSLALARAGLLLATALLLTAGLILARPAAAATPAITPAASAALSAALADEYNAEAFYAAVMDRFGTVRPFANIIRAEQRHAEAVRMLMIRYGIEPPRNTQLGSAETAATVPATLAEACRIGVDAEVANRDLYTGRLLPAAAGYPDITAVFEQLRAASETKHLPAFERCGGG